MATHEAGEAVAHVAPIERALFTSATENLGDLTILLSRARVEGREPLSRHVADLIESTHQALSQQYSSGF